MQDKEFWNQNWTAWNEDFTPSPFAEKAFAIMKVRDLHNLLDLGCGKGRNSLYFARNGLNVTAMDISDQALEAIKAFRHEKIKTYCGDIAQVDLGCEKYDAVFACLSLHYFDDRMTRQIMDKIYDALQPNGAFFIRCKSDQDRYYGIGEKIGTDIYKDELTRHFFTPEYMQDVLKRFENVCVNRTQEDYFGPCNFTDAVAFKE